MASPSGTPRAIPARAEAAGPVVLDGRVVDHRGAGPVPAEDTHTTSRVQLWAARISRVAKGMSSAPAAFRDWRIASEYDTAVRLAELGGQAGVAGALRDRQEKTAADRRDRAGRFLLEVGCIAVPVAWGGWAWFTITAFAVTAAALFLLQRKANHGKVVMRCAEVTGISLVLGIILGAALGVHPSPVSVHGLSWAWSPWYLLPPTVLGVPAFVYAVVWAWKATADDGTIADNLRAGEAVPVPVMVPAEPETQDAHDGAIVKAVTLSEAKLAKDAVLTVVAPGVMPLAGGRMWTVTLDTGGPDAGPIVAARRDVASRLGLSGPRLLVEQSKEFGRRVRLTGIVESPWGEPVMSPLIAAERFRFGDPIPYATDMITQGEWRLPMFEMHYLIGGMMRRGKSTSLYPIYSAASLDPLAPIWIIDGGDVDTRPWYDAGVVRHWTTDPVKALLVLDDVIAEIDRRQDLLAQARLVRPTPEFYAEHGMSDGLLGFDEFAAFTNHSDSKLAGQITKKLVSIIQKAPKTNIHAVLSTQSPSAKAFDTDGRGVINGRAALLCDSPEMSDKIMGRGSASRGIDASTLDETVKGLQWMSVPGDTRIVRPYLITPEQVQDIAARAARLRGAGRRPERARPVVPRVLIEMRRLLSEPSRNGRMLSVEVAAALARYELITVTADEVQGGKSEDQVRQEKVADLLRPYGVRPRPDRDAGNRQAYWLTKEHRELGDVGVLAGIARIEAGEVPVSDGDYAGSPAGSPDGSTRSTKLRAV